MAILRKLTQKQSELGFGKHVTTEGRMMNADGSFNIRRRRSSLFDNTYFHLVTMPAWAFFLLTFIVFGVINALFALMYVLIGVEQLAGMEHESIWHDYRSAFFFSSQTLTTVGYGNMHPMGLAANITASIESFLGLLFFALISGLLYGRFSRPMARIVFSDNMLVAPYPASGRALMFRMANPKRSELIETEVTVTFTINQKDEASGEVARRFFPLELELNKITFFSMSWTLVHPLNEQSPIFGLSEQDMRDGRAELLIMVKGTDESTEQLVHARRSYIADEIVWNAKFSPIMGRSADRKNILIHTNRISEHQRLEPIPQIAQMVG